MNTRTDGKSAAGRPGLVCMLLLVAMSLEAEDRIGLRDGSSRGGALQSCSTDRCTLGGSSIPIREIAWIGLGQSKDTAVAIPPAGVDQVRLHDGTTREGSFVGISLGLVILEGAEMARSTVAWIRFADPKASAADLPPPAGAVATTDAVAMRDGSTRIGELVACVGGSCLIEGQTPVARASVAAIVFGGGEDQAIQSSSAGDQDRLMLRSGATHDGPVLAIDPEQVIAVSGTFARPSVAAVQFAGEAAPSGPWGAPPDPSPTGPAQPPVGGDPPPPTPPLPPPASPPPAPPGASPQGPRRGALWTGSCRGSFRRVDASCTARTEFTADLRLREWESPLLLPGSASLERVGRVVALEPEGSVLKNTYTLDCPESGSAAGSGTITLDVAPGQDGYLHPSSLFFKDRESDLTYLLGVDLPLGGNLYTFSLSTLHTDGFPVTYRFGGSEQSVQEHGFLSCMAGNYPLTGSSIDPEIRTLEGGRMRGQFSVPFSDGTYEASWSLCREGDDCPAPEPVDEAPADPCARPGAEAALRDTCVSQLDSMLDALAPGFAEYNALMKSVEIHRPGFEEAQTYCAVYDGTILILEAILSGGTGPAARAADALLYLRDLIEKAQDGDLASLLYPEEVKRVLDAHKKAKAAWFEMTADDLAKMQRDHGACSGKVPIETWAKANRFIEDLAAARRVWESDVAPGINDLRSKGLECAGLAHLAWRACFADAACRGVAPDCGPEPSLAGAYD